MYGLGFSFSGEFQVSIPDMVVYLVVIVIVFTGGYVVGAARGIKRLAILEGENAVLKATVKAAMEERKPAARILRTAHGDFD